MAAASILLGAGASIAAPPGAACAALEQCVELCGDLGLTNLRARTLQLLGIAHIRGGNFAEARAALAAGVPTVVESGDRFGSPSGLARSSCCRWQPRASGWRCVWRVRVTHSRVSTGDGAAAIAASDRPMAGPGALQDGASVADTTRDEGRGMTIEQAVKAALANDVERPWQGPRRGRPMWQSWSPAV